MRSSKEKDQLLHQILLRRSALQADFSEVLEPIRIMEKIQRLLTGLCRLRSVTWITGLLGTRKTIQG